MERRYDKTPPELAVVAAAVVISFALHGLTSNVATPRRQDTDSQGIRKSAAEPPPGQRTPNPTTSADTR